MKILSLSLAAKASTATRGTKYDVAKLLSTAEKLHNLRFQFDLGFRVWGVGLRVKGEGCRV